MAILSNSVFYIPTYTYPGFYQAFLDGPMTSGDPVLEAKFRPLIEWWRVVCTEPAVGDCAAAITPLAVGNARSHSKLDRWVSRVRDDIFARMGHGGPALTSAAFHAGISAIRSTIQETNDANLDYDRARRVVTFEDRHGTALAQRLNGSTKTPSQSCLPKEAVAR